jgi:hypothetical protein
MIMGMRRNVEWWHKQAPVLSRRFRDLVFDNRGAGRSDKPEMDYSIRLFAEDTPSSWKPKWTWLRASQAVQRWGCRTISPLPPFGRPSALHEVQRKVASGLTNLVGCSVQLVRCDESSKDRSRRKIRRGARPNAVNSGPAFIITVAPIASSRAMPTGVNGKIQS